MSTKKEYCLALKWDVRTPQPALKLFQCIVTYLNNQYLYDGFDFLFPIQVPFSLMMMIALYEWLITIKVTNEKIEFGFNHNSLNSFLLFVLILRVLCTSLHHSLTWNQENGVFRSGIGLQTPHQLQNYLKTFSLVFKQM